MQAGSEKTGLILFPVKGHKLTLPLPANMQKFVFCSFGRDGKTVYLWRPTEAITKIELDSHRETAIRGTSGFASIWSLAVVEGSGRIVISGSVGGQCGTFEIDPIAGTRRALLAGPNPLCNGGGGEVSPEGRRTVKYVTGNLWLTDLETGVSRVIKGFGGRSSTTAEQIMWLHGVAWSPDGHWISVDDQDRGIYLIQSDDLKRRKHLASSSGGVAVSWSPDSKYLLVPKSELRCFLSLYFVSLVAVNIETGKSTKITNSHCEVISGQTGWVDPSIVLLASNEKTARVSGH
jgi:hypothetical protein